MAPADIRKEGTHFDLPLAIGILAASRQVSPDRLKEYLMIGELSLDGGVMAVKGVLPMTLNAKECGFKGVIVPEENGAEASVVDAFEVVPVSDLKDVVAFLNGNKEISPLKVDLASGLQERVSMHGADYSEVKGQERIKRALLIASAGNHNLLMAGPPGSGKTMISSRIPTILPPMSLEEAIQTTKIHSVAGRIKNSSNLIRIRPFRSPHHTISNIALIGGGSRPNPGEISLAHNGVLFMDEFPEFRRDALEVLRQPIEDRLVHLSRANYSITYPANFMLVAAMNPCPCGYYNHPAKECSCGPGMIKRYLSRISGPLLDRIDIHLEVTPVPFKELTKVSDSESSETMRMNVVRARKIQERRFEKIDQINVNAQMRPGLMLRYCSLDKAGRSIIGLAMEKLGLSARSYDRILKVARTIADLDDSAKILPMHVAEAITYRNLDREGWMG